MSARLQRLREMRAWCDAEIEAELQLLGAPLGADSLVQKAAALYGVPVVEVLTDARRSNRQAQLARQAAAWLLRGAGMSLPQIGAVLGCHHTTALYSCRKVDASSSIKALLTGLEVAA